MLTEDQLYRIITENESLQAQVKELSEILSEREEELELMKKNAGDIASLRSMLDMQLDEFHSMQNEIGVKQQQVEGAAEREQELAQELTEAAQLQQLYKEVLQEYAYAIAQLNDTQEQLLELNKRNRHLQEIAGKIGEVESELANTLIERDQLKSRIALLENKRNSNEF
jgi:chromosome segregation ATPase